MIRNILFNNKNINNIKKFRGFCSLSEKYGGKPVDLVFNVQKPSHLKPTDNQNVKNIIILHGLFGAGGNWKTISPKIADNTNCNVFQVDQRNHGISPHTNEFNYKVMSDDIGRLIEKENLNDVSIIGHSMGGRVAMLYALLYPETINKLVIVDISPSHLKSHTIMEFREYLERMDSMDVKNLKNRKEAEDWLAPVVPERGVRLFLLTNLILGDNGHYHWRINIKGLLEKIDNVASFPTPTEISEMSTSKTNKYTRPTLFIAGGKSHFIRDQDTQLINSYFPNYELEVVPNAGHWVHAEDPKTFVQIVSDFINKDN
ncbi:hypothetical protein DICPUDRAFT_154256 [Dictyostelium purpureum]|uniref:AB hydrolase-1 domain-containing protein n=1 Tax=Dictyostelium purpureum TaxID=5786 RepID=F0ZQV5_DICPU|nr:uncharacterized protein DICPUDRAFT_154256 [Dictyostelium purpureum]EGC33684.1 hypothetical protein DICPUDRAFT_154256 [Dictyostelium purpureum]|eukprot:XP_003289803.1 hypothetical protein DICPUDRAFT_154256 [Dictyostelium purpureum]